MSVVNELGKSLAPEKIEAAPKNKLFYRFYSVDNKLETTELDEDNLRWEHSELTNLVAETVGP